MPIIRKVTTVGEARGITLPKSWLDFFERTYGRKLREVALEIDDVIIVKPIPPCGVEGTSEGRMEGEASDPILALPHRKGGGGEQLNNEQR